MRAAPEQLGAQTIGRGSGRSRGGGGGGHRSQLSLPSHPKIYKNGEKMGSFTLVLANKLPKTPFFPQKYLTRYIQKTFFEEYINFKSHYLCHCGVISVQSFGSHIGPHRPGLIFVFTGASVEEFSSVSFLILCITAAFIGEFTSFFNFNNSVKQY